jgi:hypothetical protein
MSKEYIKTNGHYTALVIGTEAKKSKKGDDMLVVTFKEIGGNGGEINGYYVPKYEFMAKRLAELKTALGVGPMAKKDDMLGKKCVIGVRQQEVKPGQERINEKTGKPYGPSFEVFEYLPIQDEVALAKEVFGNNDLPF